MELKEIIDDFDKRVNDYNKIILEVIPFYTTMLNMIAMCIPYDRYAHIEILDLGCGIGNTTGVVLEYFPNAKIISVDLAARALELFNKRFKHNAKVTSVFANIVDEGVYCKHKYDCVISNLAIHHLKDDEDKKFVYNLIYRSLKPDGQIIIGENVHGSSGYLTKKYEAIWMEYMRNRGVSKKQVEQYYKEYEEKDYPLALMRQLDILKNIGFIDIDVVWKYSFFAVFCGKKN